MELLPFNSPFQINMSLLTSKVDSSIQIRFTVDSKLTCIYSKVYSGIQMYHRSVPAIFPQGVSKYGELTEMELELGNFTQNSISAFKDLMGEECTFQEYLKVSGTVCK